MLLCHPLVVVMKMCLKIRHITRKQVIQFVLFIKNKSRQQYQKSHKTSLWLKGGRRWQMVESISAVANDR